MLSSTDDTELEQNAKKARLEYMLCDQLGDSTRITFATKFPSSNVRLFEITPDIMASIESGENFEIKGALKGGDAVVCTSTKTYAIKKVETSNSVRQPT